MVVGWWGSGGGLAATWLFMWVTLTLVCWWAAKWAAGGRGRVCLLPFGACRGRSAGHHAEARHLCAQSGLEASRKLSCATALAPTDVITPPLPYHCALLPVQRRRHCPLAHERCLLSEAQQAAGTGRRAGGQLLRRQGAGAEAGLVPPAACV